MLCDDDLVVAYTRGGLQRIGRDGRLRELLFPEWRFVSLAYAPSRKLGPQSPTPGGGLLLGGTSFGYVFAMEPSNSGVLWRMDVGFLFSSMTLADAENSGRVDLVLGGIDGSMRIYELTDMALLDQRCRRLYTALGSSAGERLVQLAPSTHDTHAAVQLYLLSRVLESSGPAGQAVVDLVRWFTPGRPGWHMLPERAQRDAVVVLEHFLLLHLPQLARDEVRATRTGPLPLLTLKQLQGPPLLERNSDAGFDPATKLQLARTVLAELVDILPRGAAPGSPPDRSHLAAAARTVLAPLVGRRPSSRRPATAVVATPTTPVSCRRPTRRRLSSSGCSGCAACGPVSMPRR